MKNKNNKTIETIDVNKQKGGIFKKKYKRCPRCNYKTPINLNVCGMCELNFDKFFNVATNKEAKIAMKLKENERILYSTYIPKDVSYIKLLLLSIIGGLFGAPYFYVGRNKIGWFFLITSILTFSLATITYFLNVQISVLTMLYNILMWPFTFVLVYAITNVLEIAFKHFKIPVSIAYKEEKQ